MQRSKMLYGGLVGIILLVVSLLLKAGEIGGIPFVILFSVGIALVLASLGANFSALRRIFARRSAKYGAGAASASIFMLGVLVIVNYLAMRHNERYDSTSSKSFSLSDQTVKVVKSLDGDVNIKPFYADETPGKASLQDMLAEYEYLSPKIHVEFIDPDKDPSQAKQYKVREYGTTVVQCLDKVERVETTLEQDITNAIIKVTSDEAVKVYFLEGHGERDYEDEGRAGYSLVKTALQDENYELEKLLLLREAEVPQDCDVLVIAGPENEPEAPEVAAINDYLHKGGKVLALLDPEPSAGMRDLFKRWNISVGEDLVVDISPAGRLFGANEFMPLSMQYGKHPITENFRVATIFPECRSVSSADDSSLTALKPTVLVRTTEQSWAETGELKGKIRFDEGVDIRGPVPIAVALTKSAGGTEGDSDSDTTLVETRIVVVGDSDFASNAYFNFSGNKDLFMNMVGWLGEQEELISIRPKKPEDRRITLTKAQSRLLFYLLVVVLPVGILGSGGVVFFRRR